MCDSVVWIDGKAVDPNEERNKNSENPTSGEPESSEEEWKNKKRPNRTFFIILFLSKLSQHVLLL